MPHKPHSSAFKYLLSFVILSTAFLCAHAQKQPNIIWITCEDISPYIGAYGDKLVKTPNIDALAAGGIRYTHVYTTAGVCAPSRSAMITGMYQTSIGTQHMRTLGVDPKFMPEGVPAYSAVIPPYVKCFPEYLRKAGYYCTNNEKQDYQFEAPVTVWDENGPAASFRNRPAGKPFFAVFNLFITHESQLFMRHDSLLVDPAAVTVPAIYPDTKNVRHDMARLFTNIQRMDAQVGELVKMLKEDGLYENTYIFFFSDHGGTLPWAKREVLERGTHIPFVVKLPQEKNAGTKDEELLSAVDFAPTVLSLAGVQVPAYMQGQAFLGAQKAAKPRKYIFSARDRMDEKYDRVRAVRDAKYRYLYNYMPNLPYYQDLTYRLNIPMMKDILQLRDAGKLDSIQAAWFNTKPVEELYNAETDPLELHNLVASKEYKAKLEELRTAFKQWTSKVGDMGGMEEKEMLKQWWGGASAPPVTATPVATQSADGYTLSCATEGASIGYRIIPQGSKPAAMHTITTWDYSAAMREKSPNGQQVAASPVWQVYNGETIQLNKGDTLRINAMRIGYKAAVVDVVK
jgi:arylsulfatase A-like enzyme